MPTCDYCNSFILFGGPRKGNRRFCNDDCLVGGTLLVEADRLPQHVVDPAVEDARQSDCPECGGVGPVDIHNSHTIWSLIYLTSWKSTPNLCCRSCGRKHQFNALLTSGLFGWWGLPWGLIFTPMQIAKNLSGIFGGPDPESPSENLESYIRIDLAKRIDAGERVAGGRRRPSKPAKKPTEPTDDRIQVECDDCGKRFKAKAEMAGRTGKCSGSGCGSQITVPEPDMWVQDDDDLFDLDDERGDSGTSYNDQDYNDDRYDDDGGYDEDWSSSSPQKRSSRGASGKRGRRPAPQEPNPMRILKGVGIGLVALSVFGGLTVFLVVKFGNNNRAPGIGQNNPPVVPPFAQPNPVLGPNIVIPEPWEPGNPQPAAPPINAPLLPDSAGIGTEVGTQPVAEQFPVQPLENIDANGKLWVVLSNFREAPKKGFAAINKPFLMDYQIASGTPVATNEYVLHLSHSIGGGTLQQYSDVPVKLAASGTIEFVIPISISARSGYVATIALKQGRQKWQHFSGEIAPAGEATAAVAPPLVRDLAGAAAQGKAVAIANPDFKSGRGPIPTLTVDFVLQQPATPTGYIFLVATTPSGQKMEFDMARTLRQATVNEDSQFGGRLFGPGARIKPPFTVHVEKRKSRFQSPIRPEMPEIISNKLDVPG
jgi:hypothetical protein